MYDKIKKKNLYGKINVSIVNISGTNYKIKIEKDYEELSLFKDDLYIVEYKLLSKCFKNLWDNLLEKDNYEKDELLEDILNSE